ncbi:hypothetical protein BO71DRAFT_314292 [Aspergillus ellipticus CBS 707.79]|uniref:Uncharacterized protein n=1 Tax=Aspergillus ellipticus CBS 707.79 TaxID=1448320 RepID=A0A319F377_9EURO|nr:hypothetical protein BO71DRAFT_314292 [Aspergillus ellipticus CBS 707.79]
MPTRPSWTLSVTSGAAICLHSPFSILQTKVVLARRASVTDRGYTSAGTHE